ncbi:MAG: PEP-CTERM sorting domain-containing protein [Fimbriimonadales bacterium]
MCKKQGFYAMALLMASTHSFAFTNNILLTGYWPPTNEMLRQFSTNSAQNPGGWQGGNWENRGYNLHSYFPEFPQGSFPVGVGDFEVDYQDTSKDWARISNEIKPMAIITFSRGSGALDWELEWRQRNLQVWVNDYIAPFQPTPSPPDSTAPPGFVRFSSLPMQAIVDAVNGAGLGLNGFIDTAGFGGGFLSEFIAYHGTWYHDEHADPKDPYRNFAAGHIHVGTNVSVPQAIAASEVSLRVLTDYLDTMVPEPSTLLAALGGLTFLALRRHGRSSKA